MAERQKMSARDTILNRLKARAVAARVARPTYRPDVGNDLAMQFTENAEAAQVVIHRFASLEAMIAALPALRRQEGFSTLHLPDASPLRALPLDHVPLSAAPPSGDEAALSEAAYGIAETGTLAFLSGAGTPSSWHFLPGTEFALLRRSRIVGTIEDVLARLGGAMPATLNLVTGSSRTADIEQTIVRGAHGPRALHILLVED